MEASTDLFINLIQNNRILYDKSLKDFKNTRKKEEVWQQIATDSRMSVDAAKKRYFSLRQKYSREKRNIEIRRRKKTGTVRYWVYYERLHFLDSFIQPRSTYTNDTKFDEDDDEQMDDTGTLSYSDAPNIRIEIEEDIGNDELNDLVGVDGGLSIGIQQHPNVPILKLCQNNHDNSNDHDDSERITGHIVSQYTGEVSSIDYFATQNQNDQNSDPLTATTEEQFQQSIDMDNYVSPYPGTRSSMATIPSLPRNNSTERRNLSGISDSMNGSTISKQQPPNKSSDTRSIPQQRSYISASSIDSFATQNQNDQNNDPVTATTTEQFQQSIDMDNYVSPYPGTSSSQAAIPSLPRNNSTQRRNLSGPSDSMNGSTISKQQPPNKSSDTRSMPQQRNYISAPKATIPVKAPVGQGQMRMSERTVPSNRTSRADEAASAAAKEKRIEAIRQRMETCLAAINNKVTEKGQRSPHAPFLAYLGTKLSHVPAEILPVLEKEILELVDRHSQ